LLAAKRGNFPRFYFLSNEDLLEIIGQALNPEAINNHIQKIYEGIDRIETEITTQGKNQKEHMIVMVRAEDGEALPIQELSAS
jgi:dynein heavy chain